MAVAAGLVISAGLMGGLLGATLAQPAVSETEVLPDELSDPGRDDEVDELRQQIVRLEARLQDLAGQAADRPPAHDDLMHRARIAALEKTVRELRQQKAESDPGADAPALEEAGSEGRSAACPGKPSRRSDRLPQPLATVVAPLQELVAAAGQPVQEVDRSAVGGGAEPAVSPPVLIDYRQPSYPRAARQMGLEAIVELAVMVGEDGRVTEARRIGGPSGLGFEQAARKAAYRAMFRPGLDGSRPVAMATNLVVRFELDDS